MPPKKKKGGKKPKAEDAPDRADGDVDAQAVQRQDSENTVDTTSDIPVIRVREPTVVHEGSTTSSQEAKEEPVSQAPFVDAFQVDGSSPSSPIEVAEKQKNSEEEKPKKIKGKGKKGKKVKVKEPLEKKNATSKRISSEKLKDGDGDDPLSAQSVTAQPDSKGKEQPNPPNTNEDDSEVNRDDVISSKTNSQEVEGLSAEEKAPIDPNQSEPKEKIITDDTGPEVDQGGEVVNRSFFVAGDEDRMEEGELTLEQDAEGPNPNLQTVGTVEDVGLANGLDGGTDNMEPERVVEAASTTVNIESYEVDQNKLEEVDNESLFEYEPPTKDLPNLNSLIDTLEGGESDLEAEVHPPHLFQRPEQEPNYKEISVLKTKLEEESIDPYIDQFDTSIRDDVLMIGNISLEEVQEEERRLRDEHIAYQQQEMLHARKRQEEILQREERSKRHVTKVMKEKRKEIAKREELNLQKERLLQNKLHTAFKRAESQLLRALSIRKGEVKTMFGDLMMADGVYGGSKGRRWKVDWNKSPQPIQIKLKCLRGVKDKLPAGRYVLMTSLYDRLGGHVLRWSNLRGQEWGGACIPVNHDGQFFNIEITLDQSVFTVCPSKPKIRPGMVLIFELFLLRGSLLPVDKVVAWGAFPVCDGQFNILQGKYKTPMLRGEMDPRIEAYEIFEKLMASDLDHWLCNLYFEIIRLPRFIAGQKEYEVELQFSSQLTNFPDRVKGAEEAVDGEQPILGSALSLGSKDGNSNVDLDHQGSKVALPEEVKDGDLPKEMQDDTSTESIPKASRELSESEGSLAKSSESKAPKEDSSSIKSVKQEGSLRYRGSSQPTVVGSRRLLEKSEKSKLDDSDSESSDDESYLKKRDDGFKPVKGEPGLYYKQHDNPVPTDYMRELYTMLPKTALLNQKRKRKKLTHLEELETHSFAVQRPFSTKGRLEQKGHEKVEYVTRQILSEMGLSQWRSREFWTLILLMCLIFFMRMYLHYLGQWAFLNIISIPISKFEFLPYTVNLNYQSSLLHTREEVAVVVFGPATNIFILFLLVSSCWLCQRFLGSFPDLFCKFVMVYAIMTFLDPLLIAAVDAPLMRYNYETGDEPIADAAKLYYHFYRIHNNGLMGILLTVPIYLFIMFLAFVMFYMYFLRLHNNGRMLDIYHRLHAFEDDFFLPFDLEISNQELAYICKKAEQWRGEEGERRKIAVYDYIWEEEEEDEYDDEDGGKRSKNSKPKAEITTHVSIHTLHLDGLRELFRHFLRLPDGSIVEVFGEMGVAGIDKDLKAALQNQTEDLGKHSGSTEDMMNLNRRGPSKRPKTVGGIGSQDFLNIPGSPNMAGSRLSPHLAARLVPSVGTPTGSQASLVHVREV